MNEIYKNHALRISKNDTQSIFCTFHVLFTY